MNGAIPGDVIEAIERLGAQSNGDVAALVAQARALAPGAFADDALLARALEQAALRRGSVQERGAVWWLACAVATLRASSIASPQEDAEVVAARALGELSRSPAAAGPLPPGARWLVAGHAEPPPTAHAIELAKKNASTYIERLDAELAGRAPLLASKWQSAAGDATRAAIEEALGTYSAAAASARAGLSRVVDFAVARGGDAAVAQAGAAALAELDDVVLPALRGRIDEARRATFGSVAAPPPPISLDEGRPSFAGAAPPSFAPGGQSAPQPSAPSPSVQPAIANPTGPVSSIADLDAAMRAAFERAWASPDAQNRAAFEATVRARYEVETASIPDPEARRQALDHYVAHALAQLPQRS